MSRKIQRPTLRDANRRRSPRIPAMDIWKEFQETPCDSGSMSHQEDCGDCKGPPSQSRARIKRKLDEGASDAVSIETRQGGDSQHHEDHSRSCGKPTQLPEKRVLELVLDILQRRDIYEIFAEPVDPSEVEDYYEIIKEPMDFGTMRAKLHEGMYKNLEQFEHDVFLIPKNAMHFNSAGSTYFRQARAIHELAKKVFHVLKTDPGNFELEFSGTRRRSIRKATGEAEASRQSMEPITGSIIKDISSKGTRSSPSGPSVFRRRKGSQVFDVAASAIHKKDHNYCSGARGNRRPRSVEADRRCTYRPWRFPFDSNNSSVGSTISNNHRPLLLINQRDISYKESLMLFVKDLGPTAQMIAKKKLQGSLENSATCHTRSSNSAFQAPQCQASGAVDIVQRRSSSISAASTIASQRFPDSLLGSHSILKTGSATTDVNAAKDGDGPLCNSGMGSHGVMAYKSTEKKIASTKFYEPEIVRAENLHSSVVRNKNTRTKFTELKRDASRLDNRVLPVVLALEHSRPNTCEIKSRNKRSSTESSLLSKTKAAPNQSNSSCSPVSQCQATAPGQPDDGVRSFWQASQFLESNKSMALVSGFTFDMPFLKAQLNQMNLERGSDSKGLISFEQGRYERALDRSRQTEPSTNPFHYTQQSTVAFSK